MTSHSELLALYDAQQRLVVPAHPPAGVAFEVSGGVLRITGRAEGFVETAQHLDLTGDEVDALIATHRDFFAARNEPMEWKTRAHDLPADLPDRLARAGFVAQERETVLVGRSSEMLTSRELDPEIEIRQARGLHDLEGLTAVQHAVWGSSWSSTAELEAQLAADPELNAIYVADVGGTIVSGARVEFADGNDFAGLWTGTTLPEWRGKGIYGALVAVRAQHAHRLGVPYLQVDASDESCPILKRRGFIEITTTTPYLWTPPGR